MVSKLPGVGRKASLFLRKAGRGPHPSYYLYYFQYDNNRTFSSSQSGRRFSDLEEEDDEGQDGMHDNEFWLRRRRNRERQWKNVSSRSSLQPDREGTVRTQFEEDHHLGRQLSKYQIDESQQRQWEKLVREFPPSPQLWIPPDHIMPSPRYEMEALEKIHAKSYDANILLEVRDVRVPASSHHPSFTRLARHRVHLICYTHADLIDAATRDRVEQWTLDSWPKSKSIFLDVREHRQLQVNPATKKKTEQEDEEEEDIEKKYADYYTNNKRWHLQDKKDHGVWDLVYDSLLRQLQERGGINVALTVGVANTGKTSLLSALMRTARNRGELAKNTTRVKEDQPIFKKRFTHSKRKRKARKLVKKKGAVVIEDKPGKTRELTEYVLREYPRAYFLDVPGLTPPKFFLEERPEAWFALAAANLLPPSATKLKYPDVDAQTAICWYVLQCMNRDNNFGYVLKLGLEEPTDDIQSVLEPLKKEGGKGMTEEKLQLKRCENFLKLLNTGNFGPVILDDLRYPHERFEFKDHHFAKNRRFNENRDFDE